MRQQNWDDNRFIYVVGLIENVLQSLVYKDEKRLLSGFCLTLFFNNQLFISLPNDKALQRIKIEASKKVPLSNFDISSPAFFLQF